MGFEDFVRHLTISAVRSKLALGGCRDHGPAVEHLGLKTRYIVYTLLDQKGKVDVEDLINEQKPMGTSRAAPCFNQRTSFSRKEIRFGDSLIA